MTLLSKYKYSVVLAIVAIAIDFGKIKDFDTIDEIWDIFLCTYIDIYILIYIYSALYIHKLHYNKHSS